MAVRNPDDLMTEVLAWSPSQRGEFAAKLLNSLDEGFDVDAEEAWSEEIVTRIRSVESGQETLIPWSVARVQIMAEDDGDR